MSVTCPAASRKIIGVPSPEHLPAINFTATSISLNPLYSKNVMSPPPKKAVVVQWSAHPTWYPKFLRSLT
jgi:hypothetical protein